MPFKKNDEFDKKKKGARYRRVGSKTYYNVAALYFNLDYMIPVFWTYRSHQAYLLELKINRAGWFTQHKAEACKGGCT